MDIVFKGAVQEVSKDLLARIQMGLFDPNDKEQLFQATCEAVAEKITPPEDMALDEFSLVAGASISAIIMFRAHMQILEERLGGYPMQDEPACGYEDVLHRRNCTCEDCVDKENE